MSTRIDTKRVRQRSVRYRMQEIRTKLRLAHRIQEDRLSDEQPIFVRKPAEHRQRWNRILPRTAITVTSSSKRVSRVPWGRARRRSVTSMGRLIMMALVLSACDQRKQAIAASSEAPLLGRPFASANATANHRHCDESTPCPEGWRCVTEYAQGDYRCRNSDGGLACRLVAIPEGGYQESYCVFPCSTPLDCAPDGGGFDCIMNMAASYNVCHPE